MMAKCGWSHSCTLETLCGFVYTSVKARCCTVLLSGQRYRCLDANYLADDCAFGQIYVSVYKNSKSVIREKEGSHCRHHGQITNCYPNYCREGDGKPPSIILAEKLLRQYWTSLSGRTLEYEYKSEQQADSSVFGIQSWTRIINI